MKRIVEVQAGEEVPSNALYLGFVQRHETEWNHSQSKLVTYYVYEVLEEIRTGEALDWLRKRVGE